MDGDYFGISGAIIVLLLMIVSWGDAIRNDSKFKENFPRGFKRGMAIGLLLSVVGVLIAYNNVFGNSKEDASLIQFIFNAALSSVIATLEVGILNGMNPNPINSKYSILKKFIIIGWVGAIGIVGYTSIFLPYQLSLLLFN